MEEREAKRAAFRAAWKDYQPRMMWHHFNKLAGPPSREDAAALRGLFDEGYNDINEYIDERNAELIDYAEQMEVAPLLLDRNEDGKLRYDFTFELRCIEVGVRDWKDMMREDKNYKKRPHAIHSL